MKKILEHMHSVIGVVLFVVSTLVVNLIATTTPSVAQSETFYPRLIDLARQGDEIAQRYLEQVDALVERQGQPGVVNEQHVAQVDVVGDINVAVEGLEPFYLKIYNQQNFQNRDQIDTYIKMREESLIRLASDHPQRKIMVSISLQDYTNIDDVWQMSQEHNLDIDQMTLHLFLDEKRHSVMFVGDPEEPDDGSVVDFSASVTEFEKQLQLLLPASVLEEEDVKPGDITFKVAWIRGVLPVMDALQLAKHQSIMLVDPVSDILDAYTERAVNVRVVQVPHLLSVIETMEAVQQIGQDFILQPTPVPLQEEK